MKYLLLVIISISLCLILSCTEDKAIKVQNEDIEWIGPLNPDGSQDISDISSNEDGMVFYCSYFGQGDLAFEVFKSSDNGINWLKFELPIDCLYPYEILGGQSYMVYLPCNTGIYFSTDAGDNWNLFPIISNANGTNLEISRAGFLYAIMYDSLLQQDRIFQSKNNGVSWTEIPHTVNNSLIEAVCVDDSETIYILSSTGEILSSEMDHKNWKSIKSNLDVMHNHLLNTIKIVDKYIFAFRVYGKPIERLDTLGNSYSTNYLYPIAVMDIAVSVDDRIFIATGDGVYTSKDLGETWVKIPSEIETIDVVHLTSDGYLFIAGEKKIYRSKNRI